jgi:AcrR family transcriptional regulator
MASRRAPRKPKHPAPRGSHRAGPPGAGRPDTEERILDGALRAAARHGLAKVGMQDVSEHAGVSRGTTYRYFENREALLRRLGTREAERFERQVWQALESVPAGEERLRIALDFATRLAREHPLLQRLPETDPGLVLSSLRERFPEIRAALKRLLAPLLAETSLVREGVVTLDQLVGWTTRVLVSMFLFPDPRPEELAASMKAVFRLLTARRGRS